MLKTTRKKRDLGIRIFEIRFEKFPAPFGHQDDSCNNNVNQKNIVHIRVCGNESILSWIKDLTT